MGAANAQALALAAAATKADGTARGNLAAGVVVKIKDTADMSSLIITTSSKK